jgi:glycosyltransferase involved in cell wall biosynthesis
LSTDQRVHKVALTLQELGYDVLLVGRKFKSSSPPLDRNYATKRFNLLFNKGFLFYSNYNIRLFCYLLFRRFHLVWSVDLDTLWSGYAYSRIRKTQLVYDSHELFTEVPELTNRPFVKRFWTRIENRIFPKLKMVVTVSEPIATYYSNKYSVPVHVLRNLPLKKEVTHSLNLENKTILYQGAVNMNRGVEELVLAMQHINNATLMIVGNGDVFPLVQELVIQHKLTNKIQLLGQVPFEKLDELTKRATIGVSLEKGDAMSYHYALPNKLFDYIKNGIPVLASELPEITKLIKHYDIGQAIKTISPEEIALIIKKLLSDDQLLLHYSDNCKKAHLELNWENEKKVIYATLNPGSQ